MIKDSLYFIGDSLLWNNKHYTPLVIRTRESTILPFGLISYNNTLWSEKLKIIIFNS